MIRTRAMNCARKAMTALAPFVLLASGACLAGEQGKAPLKIDFETDAGKAAYSIDGAYASVTAEEPLSGKASLKIDTMKSKEVWTECFRTAPGVLKPDTDYVVRFNCKVLESARPDGFAYFLVLDVKTKSIGSRIRVLPVMDVGIDKSLRIKFRTPPGDNDCAFMATTKYGIKALVDDIEIKEGSEERWLPVQEERKLKDAGADPKGPAEFTIDLPAPAKELEVSVADFGASPEAQDNTPAFNKAIEHCASVKASRLVVPKGAYRFTNVEPITFKGVTDLTFDAQGSSFVFLKEKARDKNSLVKVDSCVRLSLNNFSLDWDWEKDPLGSTIKLENVAKDGSYVEFRFVDYESFPKRNVRAGIIEELDPETMSVGHETAVALGLEFHQGKDPAPKLEWVSGNLLRLYMEGENGRRFVATAKPGAVFRMRHYVYDIHGMDLRDNRHLTLSNINIYSCPGHGILCYGDQSHWQLLKVNIIRPPGSKRPITCTADHQHIICSQGFLKMESCEFSFGGDDCLNVHDNSVFAMKSGPRSVLTRNLRYSETYHEGDPIEFRNDDFSPAGFTSKLKSVKKPAKAGLPHEFTFEDEVPAQNGSGFLLFNRRYASGNVIIRNSFFHDNEARGLLMSGDNMLIENNRFRHTEKAAIMIETGYTGNSWCEGYGASNIVIRNNVFDNINPRGSYPNEWTPAIFIDVYMRRDPSIEKSPYPIIRDILIEGNKFVNSPGALINVCSASNIKFRGNSIVNDKPRIEQLPYRGSIAIESSSKIDVSGNVWHLSPYMKAPSLIIDEATSKDIGCSGNKIVEGGSLK